MKNLAIILTLLAAFALTGCSSSEKSSSAPAKAPASSSTAVTEQTADNAAKTASDAPVKKDFIITERTKKTMQEKNVQIVDQELSKYTLITKFSDGSRVFEDAPQSPKITSKDSKLGHFKPAN